MKEEMAKEKNGEVADQAVLNAEAGKELDALILEVEHVEAPAVETDADTAEPYQIRSQAERVSIIETLILFPASPSVPKR